MLTTKRYQGCAEQTERTKIEFGDLLNLCFSELNKRNLINMFRKNCVFLSMGRSKNHGLCGKVVLAFKPRGLASFSRTNGNSHKWDFETVFFTK